MGDVFYYELYHSDSLVYLVGVEERKKKTLKPSSNFKTYVSVDSLRDEDVFWKWS